MPSKKRNFGYKTIHHVYNRGVLKQTIFRNKRDYGAFLGRVKKYRQKYPVDIKAYCIMPNHFHFLLQEIGFDKPYIPRFMQQLQNSYAKYYSTKYGHSGRVFQGTYKNKQVMSAEHYNEVFHYIHENPVKAGLVKRRGDWKFSSPLRWG